MNKKELIDRITEKTPCQKKMVKQVVETMIEEMILSLASNEDVRLVGLGGFEVRKRTAREGRDPRTHEAIMIGESKYVHFTMGSVLKENVRRGSVGN
jgi:DNA-binding protein HU-beta